MKLSIIIPYFNAEKYISQLIDSLLNQGFEDSDYEIIIIDDGSTNNVEIVLSYNKRYSNIKYFYQNNSGQSTARNAGINEAKGEYLFFCDADDLVIENSLSDVYYDAHKRDLDVLFFNRFIVQENNPQKIHSPEYYTNEPVITGKDFYGRHPRIPTGPWHYIIRRELIQEHGITFPVGKLYVEDVSFLYDVLTIANRVSGIDKDVYLWIQRAGSTMHSKTEKKDCRKMRCVFLGNIKGIWFDTK